MSTPFTVVVNLKDVQSYPTFVEAWTRLYKEVKQCMDKGMTWMLLEQACYITCENTKVPIMFYEARDLAFDCGLMEEGGKLKENPDPLSNANVLRLAEMFELNSLAINQQYGNMKTLIAAIMAEEYIAEGEDLSVEDEYFGSNGDSISEHAEVERLKDEKAGTFPGYQDVAN